MVSREVSALSRLDFVIDRFWLGILRLEWVEAFCKVESRFLHYFYYNLQKIETFFEIIGDYEIKRVTFKDNFAPLWSRYHVALPRQTLPQATKAFIYFYSTHHQPALCSVGLLFP